MKQFSVTPGKVGLNGYWEPLYCERKQHDFAGAEISLIPAFLSDSRPYCLNNGLIPCPTAKEEQLLHLYLGLQASNSIGCLY